MSGPTENTSLLATESSPPITRHHNLAGLSPLRFRLICGAVWGCSFFAAFDSTVLAALTSDISSSFNAASQGSWLGTAYLLSFCCFTPVYGRLADILGRRGAHAIAMFFFTLGTLLCSIAPTMRTLIAARLIAGIGGGGVQSIAVIVLTDIVDLRHRGLFQGYGNIVFGLGGALGGPVGGWISDTFGWRVAFAVQVPACIAGAVLVWVMMRGVGDEGVGDTDWRDKAKRIDYLGSITLVFAVGSLILALSLWTPTPNSLGLPNAWSDSQVYGLLVVSLLATLAFLAVEAKFASQPLLPLSLLTRRTPLAVGLGMLTVATNQFSIMFNIPLFFSTVKLASASVAGAHLLTYSILVGVGSVGVGLIIRRTGKYWWTIIISSSCIVASQLMLCTWDKDSPEWITWVAQMPSGLGYTGVLTGTLVALMNDVAREGKGEVAVATSMSYLFRSTGQVLGVSLSAALVQSTLASDLPRRISGPNSAHIIDEIRRNTDRIRDMIPAHREAAVASYGLALRYVFLANLGLSVMTLIILLWVREEPLPERKEVEDDE